MIAIILSSLSLGFHFVVIMKKCGEFDVCLIHISADFTIFTYLRGVGGWRHWNHIVEQQFCCVSIYLLDVIRFLSVVKSLVSFEGISHYLNGCVFLVIVRGGG